MEGDLEELKVDIFLEGVTGMCGGSIFGWSSLFFVHSDGVFGGASTTFFFSDFLIFEPWEESGGMTYQIGCG